MRREQGLPPLDSFEATAREWFAVKRGGWAPSYADKIIARLKADVFPWIGQAPVAGTTTGRREKTRSTPPCTRWVSRPTK